MQFTPKQEEELRIALQRIRQGKGSNVDKQNVAYAQRNGWNTANTNANETDRTNIYNSLKGNANHAKFLKMAEKIINKSANIQQPLSAQKTFWRTLQRDTTPFGGVVDPALKNAGFFSDKRFRELSPADQASIRASRENAANAHLRGINDIERQRGIQANDVVRNLSNLINEKRALEQEKQSSRYNELKNKELELRIRKLASDNGYNVDNNGNISRDFSNATVDQIANAIKSIESGGDYNAKGDYDKMGNPQSFGAYQFNKPAGTWNAWSNEYANKVLKKSEVLPMTPENQDAVVKFKINQWLRKGYTPQEIAAKWNSGSFSGRVPNYIQKFSNALSKTGAFEAKKGEHTLWTKSQVRKLAENVSDKTSSELWNNYTDDQLDALQRQVNNNIALSLSKQVKPAFLFQLGIDKEDLQAIISMKLEGTSDDELKTIFTSLGMDPSKVDELNQILNQLATTGQIE